MEIKTTFRKSENEKQRSPYSSASSFIVIK